MKKFFVAMMLVVAGMLTFNAQADEVVKTRQVVIMRFRDANGRIYTRQVPVYRTQLPEAVINPRTYQDTNAEISYVSTEQLVQRGRQILATSPLAHYDPSLPEHANRYYRIPKTVEDIYGNRAQ